MHFVPKKGMVMAGILVASAHRHHLSAARRDLKGEYQACDTFYFFCWRRSLSRPLRNLGRTRTQGQRAR
jgi:hypothetical protein